MRVDLVTKPAALEFGSGDDAFGLYLKRWTGADRMALIDAVNEGSLARVQLAVEAMIDDWKDVYDLKGRPIPFKGDSRGADNLGEFIGSLSMSKQADVCVAVAEFVGLPEAMRSRIGVVFRNLGATIKTDPTDAPGDAGGGSASTASSESAT